MNINLFPGLRFHVDQYIKHLSLLNNDNKITLYTSSPKYKLKNIVNYNYRFIPLPFKILSRILKINTNPFYKTIDFEIYQYLAMLIKSNKKNDINHCWATFAYHIFKSNPSNLKILERSCPHIYSQINLLEKAYDKLKIKFKKPSTFSIERQILEYEMADFIIVPSLFSKKTFLDNGVNEKKIKVVNLNSNSEIKYCYKKYNKDKLIYGFCGGAVIRKGLSQLLNAWFKLPEIKNRELWLRINKQNLNIFKDINDKIKKRSDIKFINYQTDMSKFYGSLDILIHPAIEEGFGMVTIEALSAGVPLIISKFVGAIDIIKKDNFICLEEVDVDEIFKYLNLSKTEIFKLSNNVKKNNIYYKEDIKNENNIKDIYQDIINEK